MTTLASDFEARLRELAAAHGVPGASLAVAVDGALTTAVCGVLNVDTGVDVTPESVFQVGSITKPFTATLAMRLVDAGRLELDRPLREALPELRVADAEVSQSVTLRHLLTHTSGLAGDFFPDAGRGDDALARFVELCVKLGQDVPLGATFSYSNSAFVVAGRLVERLTGMTWDEAIARDLCQPLALTRTVSLPEHVLRFRAASGHAAGEDGRVVAVPFWGPPRSIGPAGAVWATPTDVVRFAQMHLDDGRAHDGTRFLSAELVREMRAPQVTVPEPWSTAEHCGLGWFVHDWDGRRLYAHDGSAPGGQRAYVKAVPDRRVIVALVTNGGQADALARELFRELLDDLCDVTLRELPTPDRGAAVSDTMVAGRYRRFGVETEVALRDGALQATTRLVEPLASQLPPQPAERSALAPATEGDAYVDASGWPIVFYEVGGRRYMHAGARALRKVA